MQPLTKEFEIFAESMPQLVWTKRADGTREYLNKKWEDYTGLSLNNKAWDWTSVIHPDDYKRTVENWDEALRTGLSFQEECRLERRDGDYRWHLARAVSVFDGKNDIVVWVGTCTDIHDNKLREEELNMKNRELLKINTDLDNFVYTASHDLKSPISNMEALITELKSELYLKIGEGEKILIDMISLCVTKLKGTIADLAEITRIQKSDVIDEKEVSFEKVLEEVKADMKNIIAEIKADITTDFKNPKVKFSQKNVRSIIYNLLSNAIKFRMENVVPQIHISSYFENGHTILAVKDNGLGIDKSKTDKVFSMFRRLHDHIEGSGLGLYIIKRVIENHDGKIELESVVGKGSVFKVYFPKGK